MLLALWVLAACQQGGPEPHDLRGDLGQFWTPGYAYRVYGAPDRYWVMQSAMARARNWILYNPEDFCPRRPQCLPWGGCDPAAWRTCNVTIGDTEFSWVLRNTLDGYPQQTTNAHYHRKQDEVPANPCTGDPTWDFAQQCCCDTRLRHPASANPRRDGGVP